MNDQAITTDYLAIPQELRRTEDRAVTLAGSDTVQVKEDIELAQKKE